MTKASKKNNDVSVVDGSLVLSFPQAAEPVVWRMNLTQAKEAGFEIREAKGKFQLVQKSGADAQSIAAFDTRDSAVDALMQVSAALQGGRTPANDRMGRISASERTQWIIAIVGVLVVIALFYSLARVAPTETTLAASPAAGTTQDSAATSADPQSASGVPVSADDFLRGE